MTPVEFVFHSYIFVLPSLSSSGSDPYFPFLPPSGLNVVEWCGHSLEGSSFEEVRAVLLSTEERKEVELVVRECR